MPFTIQEYRYQDMTVDSIQSQIPEELIEQLNKGSCVVFIGDALLDKGSLFAKLAASLTNRTHAYCKTCKNEGKCLSPFDCNNSFTYVAKLYEKMSNRQSLIEFVKKHLEEDSSQTFLTEIYNILATLPVHVMITTTYDDRLEVALKKAHRPIQVIVNDTDVPFDDPGHVQVIHLHGTFSQPESLILTDDDVIDIFDRLPIVTTILRGHFASKTLLFVGYKLTDSLFQTLYRQVTKSIAPMQRQAYAIQYPPDPQAKNLWQEEIKVVEAELRSFLQLLSQSVKLRIQQKKYVDLPPEPYKFLDYYTKDDTAIFHGRDLEADRLVSMILAHNFVVVYGRSGTGKTSLLLAKVVPILAEINYRSVYVRMLDDPISEIKAAVRSIPVNQLSYIDKGRRIIDVISDTVIPKEHLIIIIDQFEEFFLRQGENVRSAFVQELADCLQDLNSGATKPYLHFVLCLRDDYLGLLDKLNDALPYDVFAHRYRLDNLTRDQAFAAILKPAKDYGLPIEEGLANQLVNTLDDKGLEPASLQIVLYQLYQDAVKSGHWSEDTRQGDGLSLQRYRDLGEIRAILINYLDETLDELFTSEQKNHARSLLKIMVTAEHTKSVVSRKELEGNALVIKSDLAEAEIDFLLSSLRERRIIRKFGDEDRYELAHDVLVEKVWAWMSEDELRLLDLRDMLRREISNYHKFGHLMSKEKLTMFDSHQELLTLQSDEVSYVYRSALAADHNTLYWANRAQEIGLSINKIEMFYSRLREILLELYGDKSSLNRLVADAGIDLQIDDLPGETISLKIRELIRAADRRGLILGIFNIVREEYPSYHPVQELALLDLASLFNSEPNEDNHIGTNTLAINNSNLWNEQVQQFIYQHFSPDELRSLCFDLGVYVELSTQYYIAVQELLAWVESNNLWAQLQEIFQYERPIPFEDVAFDLKALSELIPDSEVSKIQEEKLANQYLPGYRWLRQYVFRYFDQGGLQILCEEWGILWNDLPSKNLSGKKLDFLLLLYKRGDLPKLLSTLSEYPYISFQQINSRRPTSFFLHLRNLITDLYDDESSLRRISDEIGLSKLEYLNAVAHHLSPINRASSFLLLIEQKALLPTLFQLTKNEYPEAFARFWNQSGGIELLNKLTKWQPESAAFYFFRGEQYFAREEFALALADFTHILTIQITHQDFITPSVSSWLFEFQKSLSRHRVALRFYNRFIELWPEEASLYYWRGITYLEQEQPQMAVSDFTQLNRLVNKNSNLRKTNDGVVGNLDMLLPADYMKNIGNRLCKYSSTGLEFYNHIIELQPDQPSHYYWRGRIYLDTEDREAAIANFIHYLKLQDIVNAKWNYRIPEDIWNVCNYLIELKAPISFFDDLVKLRPEEADFYYFRGMARMVLGDRVAAISDLIHYVELDQSALKKRKLLAEFYNRFREYPGAVTFYDRFINRWQINEAQISIKTREELARGNTYYYPRQTDLYGYYLEKSADPQAITEAYLYRGFTYYIQGDYERSFDDFEKVIQLNSHVAMAYLGRGLNCSRKRDNLSAQRDFTQFLQLLGSPSLVNWALEGLKLLGVGNLVKHSA